MKNACQNTFVVNAEVIVNVSMEILSKYFQGIANLEFRRLIFYYCFRFLTKLTKLVWGPQWSIPENTQTNHVL